MFTFNNPSIIFMHTYARTCRFKTYALVKPYNHAVFQRSYRFLTISNQIINHFMYKNLLVYSSCIFLSTPAIYTLVAILILLQTPIVKFHKTLLYVLLSQSPGGWQRSAGLDTRLNSSSYGFNSYDRFYILFML